MTSILVRRDGRERRGGGGRVKTGRDSQDIATNQGLLGATRSWAEGRKDTPLEPSAGSKVLRTP